jgi:predicted murein hydrolase (TIGR00659 family)
VSALERLGDLWQTLAASPLLWLTITLGAYQFALWLAKRTNSALLRPVLIAILTVIGILTLSGTPYDDYFERVQFIHLLLGPATVALAVPLYGYVQRLRENAAPLLAALLVGSVTAALSALGIGAILGAEETTLLSLAPKSVTTPIAMGIAENIGGLPPLTAVLVVLTGILGAVIAPPLLRLLRITDPSAKGFAIGLASHGIGTAQAFQMEEETGAFSGLGMGLNGILTTLIVPILVTLLGLR